MSKEILWLPGWYPSRLDAFAGDFIQRHARALSAFVPVHILYIVRDKDRVVTKTVEMEKKQTGNLSETIIYYASKDYSVSFADRIMSMRKYNQLYKQYLQDRYLKKEMPAAVHVHVPFKAGVIALWLKSKYGLEYYVTEHWAGYDKSNPDNFFSRPASFRYIIRKILRNSKCVIPVSEDLERKLQSIQPGIKTKIIPNTVNENFFYFEEQRSTVFRFVHYASSYKGQKNTEGLLKVFSQLQQKRNDWECVMYGPASDQLTGLVNQLGLNDRVRFTGEISYEDVARLVRSSSAFVSFSNYENQPCSILEALCCGLPVIATRVGGIPEIINQQNGLLIEPRNETQLIQAIEKMMENYPGYNRRMIAENAVLKFSYASVGQQLYSLYQTS